MPSHVRLLIGFSFVYSSMVAIGPVDMSLAHSLN